MLAEVPRCDPVYRLNMDPLLAFASAVWDLWLPAKLLEQGITEAYERIQQSGNAWGSVRGPFSACAATAIRLEILVQGFQ
eukprot:6985448-Pyramimonas_sp.AAC.1